MGALAAEAQSAPRPGLGRLVAAVVSIVAAGFLLRVFLLPSGVGDMVLLFFLDERLGLDNWAASWLRLPVLLLVEISMGLLVAVPLFLLMVRLDFEVRTPLVSMVVLMTLLQLLLFRPFAVF